MANRGSRRTCYSLFAIRYSPGEGTMTFAGVNYFAVVSAAVAAWLVGFAWYKIFGRIWMEAAGITPEEMAAAIKPPKGYLHDIYSFVADLVMAWVLAGVMWHVGPLTVRNGLISGALCWFGFVIPPMAVINSIARRDRRLLWIDGGYWLLALLVMGAIIGAFGR
jgi:Protein of unknown function (DUF1761)